MARNNRTSQKMTRLLKKLKRARRQSAATLKAVLKREKAERDYLRKAGLIRE